MFVIIFLYLFALVDCFAQNVADNRKEVLDRLHGQLKMATVDTTRINILNDLANYHKFSRADSGIYYSTKALALSRSISFDYGELGALHLLNLSHSTLGNDSKSLRINLEGLRIFDGLKN